MTEVRVPYCLPDGTVVPSVTEVLGVIPKPQLTRWANQMGLRMIDTEKLVAEYARGGTLLHHAVEAALRELPFERDLLKDFSEQEQEWARVSYRAFLAWKKEHDVVPLLLEHRMVSESMRVGGTLDLYAMVDGRFEVLDWKSSGAVRDSHLIQVAAYRALLEEEGSGVEAVRVLSLPRTGSSWSEKVVEDTSSFLATFKAARAFYAMLQSKGVAVAT